MKVVVGPVDHEIIALEADIRAAQLAADVDALDRLISEDLLFTGPDGNLATKQQDLDSHRSGAVRILEHEPIELRVRRVGDNVAIVALHARMAAAINGTIVRGNFRYTRVWAREDGAWRVVGGHVAPLADHLAAQNA
jgi:ketosteroid isomerase-like protein